MQNPIKLILRRIIKWAIKNDLSNVQQELSKLNSTIKSMSDNLDTCSKIQKDILRPLEASVDVNERTGSWAVISLSGEKGIYIKFVDLSGSNLREIAAFLKQFERRKIDANPSTSAMINKEIYYKY